MWLSLINESVSRFLLLTILLCLSTTNSWAQTARQIMDRVDEQQRLATDSMLSRSSLSSCPFAVKDKKVRCTETPRVKRMESVSRQLGEHKKDSQTISIILEPASEKGIGQLTYSYDDDTRDTESWLYLSALGKVKRMASGSGEDQEPVSLFGSEFTTEDMESGKTDEYEYKILQEGPYTGRQVWVIEALPKPVRIKKTNYSRLLLWIDQQRYVPLKVQTYDKRGNLHKRIVSRDFDKINNLWMARDVTIYNLKQQRLSNMTTEQVAMGIEIEPVFLTQRTLTDFAYRERTLQSLRQFFE